MERPRSAARWQLPMRIAALYCQRSGFMVIDTTQTIGQRYHRWRLKAFAPTSAVTRKIVRVCTGAGDNLVAELETKLSRSCADELASPIHLGIDRHSILDDCVWRMLNT